MHAPRRWMTRAALTLAGLGGLALAGCTPPNPILRQQAEDSYRAGRYSRATRFLQTAVKEDPSDWRAQLFLAEIALEQNRNLDAQVALEKALIINSKGTETPYLLDLLAESIYRQNKPEELAGMLQKATEDYHTPADYLRQARYLGKAGDADGAKLAFRKAARASHPSDATPYMEAADYLESIGDIQGAIQNWQYAYWIVPGNPRIEEKFRKYGIVPGPTQQVRPPRD